MIIYVKTIFPVTQSLRRLLMCTAVLFVFILQAKFKWLLGLLRGTATPRMDLDRFKVLGVFAWLDWRVFSLFGQSFLISFLFWKFRQASI